MVAEVSTEIEPEMKNAPEALRRAEVDLTALIDQAGKRALLVAEVAEQKRGCDSHVRIAPAPAIARQVVKRDRHILVCTYRLYHRAY